MVSVNSAFKRTLKHVPRTLQDKPLVSRCANDARNNSEIAQTDILPSNLGSLAPINLPFQLEDLCSPLWV